jgi:hypothetical protein
MSQGGERRKNYTMCTCLQVATVVVSRYQQANSARFSRSVDGASQLLDLGLGKASDAAKEVDVLRGEVRWPFMNRIQKHRRIQ